MNTISLPDGPPRGGVVTLHPASDGSRDNFLLAHVATLLVPRDVAVLRYDRRAKVGEADVAFADQAQDALAAVRELRAAAGDVPIGLWGWSQGGWPAAIAAAESEEVAFLALVSATAVSPAQQMRYGTAKQLRLNGYGEDDVADALELRVAREDYLRGAAGRHATQAVVDRHATKPWFALANVPSICDEGDVWADMDFDLAPAIRRVRCPVLLVYGDDDEWTPVEPSIEMWRQAQGPVEVLNLAGAGHAPTDASGVVRQDYADGLAAFVDRVLS